MCAEPCVWCALVTCSRLTNEFTAATVVEPLVLQHAVVRLIRPLRRAPRGVRRRLPVAADGDGIAAGRELRDAQASGYRLPSKQPRGTLLLTCTLCTYFHSSVFTSLVLHATLGSRLQRSTHTHTRPSTLHLYTSLALRDQPPDTPQTKKPARAIPDARRALALQLQSRSSDCTWPIRPLNPGDVLRVHRPAVTLDGWSMLQVCRSLGLIITYRAGWGELA